MKLHHQREICSDLLHYNLETSDTVSRARIPQCNLIIGEGNAGECRRAVKHFLLSDKLRWYTEAAQSGFLSVSDVGELRTHRLNNVAVLGSSAPLILDTAYRYNFVKNATGDFLYRYTLQSPVYNTTLSVLQNLAESICGRSLLSMLPEVGRAFSNAQSCFHRTCPISGVFSAYYKILCVLQFLL